MLFIQVKLVLKEKKDRVKGLGYNYTFLTSDLFIWMCHFTVSWETAQGLYVYSDERRCD